MRRFSVLPAALVMVPALAFAHVTVAPRVSKPGAEEKYTVVLGIQFVRARMAPKYSA